MEEQEVRARTRQETHDRNRRRNNHCAVPIRWRPIRRSLRSACGNGVFPPRPARRSSGSHAAARHALEHALQLGRAVREAVAPEAIARVLDELYESDQKPPLSTTRIDNGRDRGGQGGGGEREASGYVLYGRGGGGSLPTGARGVPPWSSRLPGLESIATCSCCKKEIEYPQKALNPNSSPIAWRKFRQRRRQARKSLRLSAIAIHPTNASIDLLGTLRTLETISQKKANILYDLTVVQQNWQFVLSGLLVEKEKEKKLKAETSKKRKKNEKKRQYSC